VISVSARVDVPGFIGWSNKAGVWQVQPPAPILAKMLAVRVHLDDCGLENGPLRVLPGSHQFGWLEEQLDVWKERVPEVVCEVRRGGVVTMCPLLLHASAKSATPGHRRVIHVEYACDDLPEGLEWNNRIGGLEEPRGR
jgi:ectoine hydroxylase-related dioxygenase (phytanoyl-CoA dioxygenase family)